MIKNFHKGSFILLSGVLLFASLACNATFTVLNPTPTPIPPTPEPAQPTATSIPLSQQVTLIAQPFEESNQSPIYTLKAQTPQLTGSDDPRVLVFNQRLNELVQKEVDLHRQGFLQNPATPISNGSSLDVTYTLISQYADIWSLKFDFHFYSDGAAHPGLYSMTVNYDLRQSRELALSELFIPNSNYLEMISNYCIAELNKQPGFEGPFSEGANPTLENYRNWNITPNGLLITFDTYQVAPGASGPQTVIVPFGELQALIDPQGPLANIAQ